MENEKIENEIKSVKHGYLLGDWWLGLTWLFIRSYYCTCSQFILSITPDLDHLPKRQDPECQSIAISREKDQCIFTFDAYRDRYPISIKKWVFISSLFF